MSIEKQILDQTRDYLEGLEEKVKQLEASGGGGTGDSYTKAQSDAKYETKTNASNIYQPKSGMTNYYTKAEVDDVLNVSEPVNATNTEYITKGNIIWKRSGNVVEVTFSNVAFNSQTSGDVTLATGLPPSKNYSWSIIKSLTDTNVQQGVAVKTDGSLTSIGGSTHGSGYYDSFTYLAAD